MIEELRGLFPHGHHQFIPNMIQMTELHSMKNRDYAKGGSALGNFERVAEIMSQYPQLNMTNPLGVVMMYMVKHFDFIMNMLQSDDLTLEERAKLRESYGDMAVYSMIALCILSEMNG